MKQKTLAQISFFGRVISFAKPFQRPLIFVFFGIIGVTIVDALNSWCLSRVFDIVQKNGTNPLYLTDAFIFIGLAAFFVIIRILMISMRHKIEVRQLDIIMPNYLNHQSIAKFFSFSGGQHINEHSGVKQTIVNSGIGSIQNQINLCIYQFIPSVAQFFVAMGVLFYANSIVGFVFLGIGVMFCVMMYSINKMLVPGFRKMRERKQLNSRLMSELYRLVTFIKNESQEDRSLVDISDAQQKHQDIYQETWLPAIGKLQNLRLSTALIRYGAMFFVVWLLFHQQMSVGAMFLCFVWSGAIVSSLWDITDLHKKFLMDKTNIEKYFDLLEIAPDIIIAENPIKLSSIKGMVEFKNITFRYPRRVKSYEEDEEKTLQNDAVLKNVSFVIEPGQKIGIVGESGSGKSTLANLIRRGFDPEQGQILIDGNDLRLLDLKDFLQKIGSVEQEVSMLDRSIRENILFGLEKPADISEERLRELSTIARIDGFFERLEHGFDTIVGEKGVKLSGGERQRVGIARALAKEPSILIFDEATSALDSLSEHIVQQSIDEACKGKTAIVIAHRLSTVRNCDKILVFRAGILVEEGTHDELIQKSEYYAELIQHQMVNQ